MYPRRYLSYGGTPVLIGLTADETSEFEQLDSASPLGLEPVTDRLLSLYLRHQSAYEAMMASENP